ncbi:MAG: hypothetical protein AAF678_05975, partial [Pseudomonadota bacterium]
MTELTSLGYFAAIPMAALIAAAILWVSTKMQSHAPMPRAGDSLATTEFQIRDEEVIENGCAFEPFPFGRARPVKTWQALRHYLEPRFGTLPTTLKEIAPGDDLRRPALDETDPGILTLSGHKTTQRAILMDRHENDAADLHRSRLLEQNLASCLAVMDSAPCAMR